MRQALGILVLAGILWQAPWRLGGLLVETMALTPARTRISTQTDRYWDCLTLEAKLVDMGWVVSYEPDLEYRGQKAYGLTIPSEHHVYVERGLSWNARYAVLAHEAGHTVQPSWMDHAEGEAWAEEIATVLTKDGIREHARYLASIRWTAWMVGLIEWRSIYHAATFLGD